MGDKRQVAFTAPENYQAVYRKVLDQSRKCWQSSGIAAQLMVQGDLFDDIRSGTVTVAMHGMYGVDTYQVIDITAIDDAQTKVVAHYALGSVEGYGRTLKGWVLQDETGCAAK